MEEKVRQAIEEMRHFLQADGGDIELVKIENNVVHVRLKGACAGCPGAQMTLRMGVERKLKQAVPEVERVEAVT